MVLKEYRQAKRDKFADIIISIDKGSLAKLDVTRKKRGDDLKVPIRHLKEDGNGSDNQRQANNQTD